MIPLTAPRATRRFSIRLLEPRIAPATLDLGFFKLQLNGVADDVKVELGDVYLVTADGPVAVGDRTFKFDDMPGDGSSGDVTISDVKIRLDDIYITPGATISIDMNSSMHDVKLNIEDVYLLHPGAQMNIGLTGPMDDVKLNFRNIFIGASL